MEKLLLKISNTLIVNLQNIDGIGLMNGKTGIALVLYSYARMSQRGTYEEKADDLLSEMFSALSANIDHSVINGLSGIGVGLNFLLKNKFIITDEKLDDLFKSADEKSIEIVKSQFINEHNDILPLHSIGFYALSRITTSGMTTQIKNLLSVILENINNIFNINENKNMHLSYYSSALFFLNSIYKYRYCRSEIRECLSGALRCLKSYILSEKVYFETDDLNLLTFILGEITFYKNLTVDIMKIISKLNGKPTDYEYSILKKLCYSILFHRYDKSVNISNEEFSKMIDYELENFSPKTFPLFIMIGLYIIINNGGIQLSFLL